MDALATTDCQVYRPRKPRNGPLYQCVIRHTEELREAGKIRRIVEEQVLERFQDCGDLHKGFARIHCDKCGYDYLLALRCVPSLAHTLAGALACVQFHSRRNCPAKRAVYGGWVEDTVLAPVPHRQYVFTLPKSLRPYFHHRAYLGELCRMIGRLLNRNFNEVQSEGRPGFILFVQTFGDLVNFIPHIHALVTDGVFKNNGVFRVMPPPGFSILLALSIRWKKIFIDNCLTQKHW